MDEAAALKAEILLLKRRNDILTKKEKRIQGIVTAWGKKPVEEQQFEPYHRAVSAAAFNTGTMLKSAATVITQVLRRRGIIGYHQHVIMFDNVLMIDNHWHYHQVIKAQKLMGSLNGSVDGVPAPMAGKAAGSKACAIM